jgi:uncharacterized protein (TIGR03000 family)
MLRFKLLILATLALAAFLWTTGPVGAGRGGGHGGGGHGGGGHGGGGHGGGGHGGQGGHGGHGHGGFHRGFYGYGGFYPGYGYYPGYSSGYGYGAYYPSYAYGYGDSLVDPALVTTRQSFSYTPPADNRARIRVRVPRDAELWIAGDTTRQRGVDRLFTSPALSPGKTYTYEIKVRWMDGNRPVEAARKVEVRANETTDVDFTRPVAGG